VHPPGAALQYLSRYVVGSAISDVRIVSDEDGQVTFRVKDYKNGGEKSTLTIPGEEFVRRFSLHILPPRMMRVRYAGWLGSNIREVNLATARTALNVIAAKEKELDADGNSEKDIDLEDLLEDLADMVFRCPNCGELAMRWQGEIISIMGWHPFQCQVPPIASIRQMFADAAAHFGADKIRPPPTISQSI
jgi:hypothetical protein